MSTARSLRAQANSAHRADADNYVAVAPSLTASNDPSRSPQSSEVTQQVYAVLQAMAEREVVGTLSDGAHQGGGLTAKMPTRAAYSPALANPLTARMGKGINTTLDEGQTPIVCQREGGNDF